MAHRAVVRLTACWADDGFQLRCEGLLRVPWNSQNWFRCRLTHFEHQNCFWRFRDCLGGGRGAPGDSATDCVVLFSLCFFASLVCWPRIGLRRARLFVHRRLHKYDAIIRDPRFSGPCSSQCLSGSRQTLLFLPRFNDCKDCIVSIRS